MQASINTEAVCGGVPACKPFFNYEASSLNVFRGSKKFKKFSREKFWRSFYTTNITTTQGFRISIMIYF
jgi:hypothetical protein